MTMTRTLQEELPQMYPPMNYQEFDVSQSPANQLSPQFIEEQVIILPESSKIRLIILLDI